MLILHASFWRPVLRRGPAPTRLLSLGNPMFVHRPPRPLPPADQLDGGKEDADVRTDSSGGADFLTDHGGKIALVGFSFAAALVYRWFKGGRNRTELEEQITLMSPLHPYECNELRVRNSMTCSQFTSFCIKCREKFASDGLATYDEFVKYFREQNVYKIKDGYLLDRVVLKYLEAISSTGEISVHSARLPVSFFLVALSNVVNATPDDRIALLFDVAKGITKEELVNNAQCCFDRELGVQDDENLNLYCEQRKVEALVGYLVGAHQIPYEKMIQESGVYYPFKLFRKKTASEMVAQGISSLKPPPHKPCQFSLDEFTELIASSSICVWGECYRKS